MEQIKRTVNILFDARNLFVSIVLAAVTAIIWLAVFYRKRREKK